MPKKNGFYRMYIDYRLLNRKIIKYRFSVPLVEEKIDDLRGARIFSLIDLTNGFFHVSMTEKCIKYTSFVTPSGQY